MLRKKRSDLHSSFGQTIKPHFAQELSRQTQLSFDDFKKSLSVLKVTPSLAAEMSAVVQKSSTGMNARMNNLNLKRVKQLLPSASDLDYLDFQRVETRRLFDERIKSYTKEKLMKARVKGSYKPAPRKGIGLGLHWLLPEGFGTDFRRRDGAKHAMDPSSIVYTPKNKRSELDVGDVMSNSWRKRIVPARGSEDIVFTP